MYLELSKKLISQCSVAKLTVRLDHDSCSPFCTGQNKFNFNTSKIKSGTGALRFENIPIE